MTPGPGTDRRAAAVDLLSALYPPPLAVTLGAADAGRVRAVWTAVPSAGNPRLLVPGDGPAAATRTLRRQLTGGRLRTRVARTGLTLASGSGVLGRVPRLRFTVAGPRGAASIEDPLRTALRVDDLRIAMPVGPARSNRKPVLQVTDRRGRVLGFAKVGHNDLTRRLVRQEAATLAALAGVPPAGVRLPGVVALVPWQGNDVLVLEPLRVPRRRLGGRSGRRRLEELALAIAATGGLTRQAWARHPYRAVLHERVDGCGRLAGALRRQLELVDPGLELTWGSWHGDLNPGNLALVAGACPVWDWERFETGVPLGFDLLHHDLQESITLLDVDPRVAATRLLRGAAATLAPLDVGAGAESVARLYLVTLACRYLVDGQADAGAALGQVDQWLLPALEEAGQ